MSVGKGDIRPPSRDERVLIKTFKHFERFQIPCFIKTSEGNNIEDGRPLLLISH